MSKEPITYTFTSPVVMLFPNLLKPAAVKVAGKETGKPKYGATFLMGPDHPDLIPLKQKMVEAAQEMWPGRDLTSLGLTVPLKQGDAIIAERLARGKKAGDEMKGKIVFKASSEYPPVLCGAENGQHAEYSDEAARVRVDKTKFFPGAEVYPLVSLVAYDLPTGAKFITAYLTQVFGTGQGKRIAGGRSSADVFKNYAGKLSAVDPTKSAGDSTIPF